MQRIFLAIAIIIFLGCSTPQQTQTESSASSSPMDKFITELMAKMTLDEKIGQLNLPGAGDITTGQASSSNIAEKIKAGQVGGLFNFK